jgi:hypothetical protein
MADPFKVRVTGPLSGRELIAQDVDERPLIAVLLSESDSPAEQTTGRGIDDETDDPGPTARGRELPTQPGGRLAGLPQPPADPDGLAGLPADDAPPRFPSPLRAAYGPNPAAAGLERPTRCAVATRHTSALTPRTTQSTRRVRPEHLEVDTSRQRRRTCDPVPAGYAGAGLEHGHGSDGRCDGS